MTKVKKLKDMGGGIGGGTAIGHGQAIGGSIGGIPTGNLQNTLSGASIRPKILENEKKYANLLDELCDHEERYFFKCLTQREISHILNARSVLNDPPGQKRNLHPDPNNTVDPYNGAPPQRTFNKRLNKINGENEEDDDETGYDPVFVLQLATAGLILSFAVFLVLLLAT